MSNGDGNNPLGPAHLGYTDQDLTTSYFLLSLLLDEIDEVTVDRKVVLDDRFDDLAIRRGSIRIRRQIKSSKESDLPFDLKDLTTKTNKKLTIDALVRSYTRAGTTAANEYRVCASWRVPTGEDFLRFFESVNVAPSFLGHPSKTFRLRSEIIWPDNEPPVWRALDKASDITRNDFLEFANRFVLELECPRASRDFSKPGEIETLILSLLSDSVGIGSYPNHHRNRVEVAARLAQFATRARSHGLTLTGADVERELQLQKDFGRVEQQFPVVTEIAINRPPLRRQIEAHLSDRRVIVEGPPGSGKSWELTGLAEDLRAKGYLVARHYCYLEPGDPDVQRRITTDVMFANLIYELTEANPALGKLHRPAYSAGPRELEELLRKGFEAGIIEKAVLIVDGIDHISRVFAGSTGVSRVDVDIVEELATLDLPDGVCLILGSQPGEHLSPLHDEATSIAMPPWSYNEVAALSERLNVPHTLRGAGFGVNVKAFLLQLYERSEGNPLYATFLCRQIRDRITLGEAFDPIADLRNAPLTGGNISVYYDYLLDGAEAGDVTGPVAELLGLIDFGLSIEELSQILPAFGHRLQSAVGHLRPVLAPAGGGLRVYHESFRRFISERLETRGGSAEAILAPVIEWMKSRGFFDDARSYRFLLPTLRRANRRRELLELVSADFVSRSVEAGHFRSAVEQNLAVTIYTAAEELEWASLTRCVELYKACNICFQEKLTDYDLFGRAFMAVRGASALAERLLFDGRPTINALPGLLLCSLCDDAGATPPWDQYLALVKKADSEEARHDEQDWLKYELAKVHGEIRLYGADAFYPRLVAWVNRVLDPPPEFLRGILARLTAIGSAAFLRRLVEDVSLSPEVNGQIRIELASALAREGKASEVAQAATEAIVVTNSVTIAAQGLTLGADKVEAIKCIPSFDDEKVGLNEEYGQPDKAAVRRWVDGIKIAVANDSPTVETAANYVRGIGWYKNWLRFVISLARAEELAKHDPVKAENDTLVALRQLASDTEPFKGKPRACDLYSVRDIIHETVARALRLIHEPANFEEALTSLVEIERGTSTSLGNFPNGPLTGDALLELLLPFVKNADLKDVALAEMTRQLGRIDEGELIYDTVANADLLLSRALADAGDEDAAKQRWQSASVRLCAYGFRADTSIFDLFEGAAALRKIDVGRASRALARTQPLVNAASARTDGKETQYAPAAWVAALAEVDPTAGAFILARSMVRNGGAIDWRYENALEKVIDAVRGQGSPVLEAFIDATFPRRLKAIEEQLSTLGRLAHQDFNLATQLLMLLASKASDTPEVYELVKGFAHQIHATLPVSSTITQPGNRDKKSVLPQADPLDKFRDTPFFPENASPLEIMRSIRTARRSFDEADATEDRLINAFGYRLIEILEGGDQEGAIRLLKVFSRETYFWAGASALAGLGEGLERHGHMHAAAVAFTLAYARSRGGGGYHFLGDEKHLPWLLRAVKISRETASRLLAEEIAYLLSQHGYYAGITHHQLEALASQPETREAAFEAWEAAYEVLNHRLPGNEDDYFVFEKYDPSNTPPWSVDESLFFLLLGRICHPEIGRKITAVAGISKAIENLPEVVGRPLREFFRVDVPVSTAILILQTLISVEQEPFPVTTSIAAELIQLYRSGLFALRAASQLLLERAGLTIDPGRPAVSIEADPPPERKMNAILSIERGKRVRVVGSFWPKFPGIVAGRFHDLWEQVKAHNERAGIRHKAARSRVYSGLPPANFLFWERELFETVFQEVLEGIDIQLWSTGDWHPDFPIWMLGNILPRLPLHIGRLYSRSPRPPLPRPQEQGTRVEATKPLSDGDEYSGWFRCGSFEREILTERIHRVTDEFMAMSSVQFLAAPTVPDSTFMPLAQGNVDVWFERQDVPDVNVHGLTGPAVGLDFLQDWLGNSPLLMLQPYIQSRLKISSSDPWHNRLQMVDESGEVAVILRCWEEKPVGDSVGEEIARLQGCDLIVRPDVFVRMRAVSSHGPFTAIYSSCDKSEGEEDGGNSCAQAADRSETDLPQ